jgi:hypothetical protein
VPLAYIGDRYGHDDEGSNDGRYMVSTLGHVLLAVISPAAASGGPALFIYGDRPRQHGEVVLDGDNEIAPETSQGVPGLAKGHTTPPAQHHTHTLSRPHHRR